MTTQAASAPPRRRMCYKPAQDELTVAVWSPRLQRPWLITPRQLALMTRIHDGRSFTTRELADELGYSQAGLRNALHSLVSGCLISRHATKGRLGSTWAFVRAGVQLITHLSGNVITSLKRSKNVSLKGVSKDDTLLPLKSTADEVRARLRAWLTPDHDRHAPWEWIPNPAFEPIDERRLLSGIRLLPEPIR